MLIQDMFIGNMKDAGTSQADQAKLEKAQKVIGSSFVKIVNEKQFVNMMNMKATSKEWKAIECIQTCVKTKYGLGKYIPL